MGVVTDLRPLANKTVTATLGTVDEWGKFTSSSTVSMQYCHIELEYKRVLDATGNEVTSRGSVFSLEDNSLFPGRNTSNQEYRFTLPSSWPEPRTNLRAINIIREEDDEGEVYEEIVL